MFAGTELSAMTGTAVFRWLPCPRLRGTQASPWWRSPRRVPPGQTAGRDRPASPSRHAAYASFPKPADTASFQAGAVLPKRKWAAWCLQSGTLPRTSRNRKFAALHHGAWTKSRLMTAIRTCPGPVAWIPAEVQTAAYRAVKGVAFAVFPEGTLTGFLVRISLVEISQIHNDSFLLGIIRLQSLRQVLWWLCKLC